MVQEILKSECIAGLIIVDPDQRIEYTDPLSHDGICPNRYSGKISSFNIFCYNQTLTVWKVYCYKLGASACSSLRRPCHSECFKLT